MRMRLKPAADVKVSLWSDQARVHMMFSPGRTVLAVLSWSMWLHKTLLWRQQHLFEHFTRIQIQTSSWKMWSALKKILCTPTTGTTEKSCWRSENKLHVDTGLIRRLTVLVRLIARRRKWSSVSSEVFGSVNVVLQKLKMIWFFLVWW